MGDTLSTIGLIGGIVGAVACVIAALVAFHEDSPEWGGGLLIAAPIVFFLAYALTMLVIVGAVLALIAWIAFESS